MTTSTAAELAAAADAIGRYRQRVAALTRSHLAGDRDDLVAAIHEAERALQVAERQLERASRLADTAG